MGPKKTANTSSKASGASPVLSVLRPFDTAQLNPIYAMVSARNYKGAIRSCQILETNYGPHPSILVVLLYSLASSDASRDEIRVVSSRLTSQRPTQLHVLNTWLMGAQRASYYGDFFTIVEAAHRANPKDIEMARFYVSTGFSIINGPHKRPGQLTRMLETCNILRSTTKNPSYAAWAALCCLLDNTVPSGPHPTLTSVESALKKVYPVGKLPSISSSSTETSSCMPMDAFLMLLRVIIKQIPSSNSPEDRQAQQERITEALSLLSSPRAQDLRSSDSTEFALWHSQLLLRSGNIAAALQMVQKTAEEQPDNWLWVSTTVYLSVFSWVAEETLDSLAESKYATLSDVVNALTPSFSVLTAGSSESAIGGPSLASLFHDLIRTRTTLTFSHATLSVASGEENEEEVCSVTEKVSIEDKIVKLETWLQSLEKATSVNTFRAPCLGLLEVRRVLHTFAVSTLASNFASTSAIASFVLSSVGICGFLTSFSRYFARFGGKPCFYEDVQLSLSSLATLHQYALPMNVVSTSLSTVLALYNDGNDEIAMNSACFSAQSAPVLSTLSLALRHYWTSLTQKLPVSGSEIVEQCASLPSVPILDERGALYTVSLCSVDRHLGLTSVWSINNSDIALSEESLVRAATYYTALHSVFERSQSPTSMKEKIAKNLAVLTSSQNHLELPIDPERVYVKSNAADPLLVLAAYSLLEAFSLSLRRGTKPEVARKYLFLAAGVLENGLLVDNISEPSERNYILKLLLLRIYSHPLFGNPSRIATLRAELDVKQIQTETLYHLVLPEYLRWGFPSLACDLAKDAIEFSHGLWQHANSSATEALRMDKCTQVGELLELRDRVIPSLSLVSAHTGFALARAQVLLNKTLNSTVEIFNNVREEMIEILSPELYSVLFPFVAVDSAGTSMSKIKGKAKVSTAVASVQTLPQPSAVNDVLISPFTLFRTLVSNCALLPNNQDYTVARVCRASSGFSSMLSTSSSLSPSISSHISQKLNRPDFSLLHADVMVPTSSFSASSFPSEFVSCSSSSVLGQIIVDETSSLRLSNIYFGTPASLSVGLCMQLFWLPRLLTASITSAETDEFEAFLAEPVTQAQLQLTYTPNTVLLRAYNLLVPALKARFASTASEALEIFSQVALEAEELLKQAITNLTQDLLDPQNTIIKTLHTEHFTPLYSLIAVILHAIGSLLGATCKTFPAAKSAFLKAFRSLSVRIISLGKMLKMTEISSDIVENMNLIKEDLSELSELNALRAFLVEQETRVKVVSEIEYFMFKGWTRLIRSYPPVFISVGELFAKFA